MRDLHNNFVPLRSILHALKAVEPVRSSALRQLLGNLFLLLPIAFLGSVLWSGLRGWKQAVLLGVCFSTLIELLQFVISAILRCTYRTADIDDVLLNTLGSVVGFAAFLAASKIAALIRQRRRHNDTRAASDVEVQ
jgi:glycopeptide antibiotics resistance protein